MAYSASETSIISTVADLGSSSFSFTSRTFSTPSESSSALSFSSTLSPASFLSTSSTLSSSSTLSPSSTISPSLASSPPSALSSLPSCQNSTSALHRSGLGGGVKAGIGIGIAVGASLMLHVFLFYLHNRRKKTIQTPPVISRPMKGEMNGGSMPTEVDGRSRRLPELSA